MKNPKVLIVDDNASSRLMAQYCLSQLGCESDAVNDGFETLEKLRNEHYDLIVLDWNMPLKNGRETLLDADIILKQLNRAEKSHVIVYSALPVSHLNIPASKLFNVAGYLSKGLSPHKQLLSFKKYVELVRRMKEAV